MYNSNIAQLRFSKIAFVVLVTTAIACQQRKLPPPQEPIPVEVEIADFEKGYSSSRYSGSVEPSTTIPLSFLPPGEVKGVYAREGQRVKKGQLLATLNDVSLKNSYNISTAQEERAKDAYNRMEPMYKNGTLPEIKYIEIKTGLEQATSAARVAKENLDNTMLYSPCDGIISSKNIESGMNVFPNNTVFELVTLQSVSVVIPVPENEISQVKLGVDAEIVVNALNDKKFEGKVTQVGVVANPLSHAYTAKINIANASTDLLPGMICEVRLLHSDSVSKSRRFIPHKAVQVDENGKNYVYSVDGANRVVKMPIEIGLPQPYGIPVEQGLQASDRVIISGYQKVTTGVIVKII